LADLVDVPSKHAPWFALVTRRGKPQPHATDPQRYKLSASMNGEKDRSFANPAGQPAIVGRGSEDDIVKGRSGGACRRQPQALTKASTSFLG